MMGFIYFKMFQTAEMNDGTVFLNNDMHHYQTISVFKNLISIWICIFLTIDYVKFFFFHSIICEDTLNYKFLKLNILNYAIMMKIY